MYVYQNGKLYIQHDNDLFGVEIHPDEVVVLEDEKGILGKEFELFTHAEVQAVFHEGYSFPKKEVKVDDTVGKAKGTNRKSSGK